MHSLIVLISAQFLVAYLNIETWVHIQNTLGMRISDGQSSIQMGCYCIAIWLPDQI